MKKSFVIIISICCATICNAEVKYPMMKEVAEYDCVNYYANKLIYPGDSSKAEQLYKRLDTLALFGREKINIVHIGGSHIQADVISNRVRMNLAGCIQGLGSGRGVIFPYKAAKTNNPKNYKITYGGEWIKSQNSRTPIKEELGITGYAISTNDEKAYIEFELNPEDYSSIWCYNKLRLLAKTNSTERTPMLIVGKDTIPGNKEEDSYTFNLHNYVDKGKIILGKTEDIERLKIKYKNAKKSIESQKIDSIDTVNDSITIDDASYTLEIGMESDNGLENIEKAEQNSEYKLSITGIIPENDINGITYHSLGVNGASLRSWLRCGEFENQMRYIKPDMAIMEVGINDANMPQKSFDKERYKRRYNELINKIYANNPNCAVIFITNNDCVYRPGKYSYGTNPNSAIIREAIYELAKKHNAAVWDMFEIMGGLGSIAVWNEEGLAKKDKIHFTVTGYNLLGDLLYNAIIYDWLYKKDETNNL